MKNPALLATLACLLIATPAIAQPRKHALGDMYTKALNMAEAQGMLDALEPKRHVEVTDIHMDHGSVYLTFAGEKGPVTIMFDPMANKIVPVGVESAPHE